MAARVAFLIAIIKLSKAEDWSYYEQESWSGLCESGLFQSPVNIPRQRNEPLICDDLNFDDFAVSPERMRIINTGRYLEIKIPTRTRPKVASGCLNGTFLFEKARFHWSPRASRGSEHSKSSTNFPMEVQVFLFNDKFDSLENAFQDGKISDSVAILSTLLQISVDLSPTLEYFTQYLSKVEKPNEFELPQPLPLNYLLPKDTENFYR